MIRRQYYHLPLADKIKQFLVDLLGKYPTYSNILKNKNKVRGEQMIWLSPKYKGSKLDLDIVEIIKDFVEDSGLKRNTVKLEEKIMYQWNPYCRRCSGKFAEGLEVIVIDPNGRRK